MNGRVRISRLDQASSLRLRVVSAADCNVPLYGRPRVPSMVNGRDGDLHINIIG